jgi:hypothetical protein
MLGLAAALFACGSAYADPPASGTIRGTIEYPSEDLPAMSIFALGQDGASDAVVRTSPHQKDFVLGVAPGTYTIVGYANDDPGQPGGFTQFVSCGESASCTDHSLVPVSVEAGQETPGVRVADWYAPPGQLPAMPVSGQLTDQIRGAPCGDPTVACTTRFKFMDSEMPFEVADSPLVPNRSYESKFFYAVVLKELPANGAGSCNTVPEAERLEAQLLFPTRKVFTTQHYCDGEREAMTGIPTRDNVMGLYAGATEDEAKAILGEVLRLKKFKGAHIVPTNIVLAGTH